jgi:undecaprenyl-diphosphatase
LTRPAFLTPNRQERRAGDGGSASSRSRLQPEQVIGAERNSLQRESLPALLWRRLEAWTNRLPPRFQHRIALSIRWLGSIEIVTLAAILLVGGAVWLFAELADEVVGGETEPFDRAVLLLLRNPLDRADPLGPPWLEHVFRDLTALGGYTVITLAAILAFLYLAMLGQWLSAKLLVLSLAGATIVNNLLKFGFDRPRPDFVAHLVEVQSASFPSGHAMLSAIAYLSFGALLAGAQPGRRMKVYVLSVAMLLTLLIGVSRIYLGVHWPSDVLAGWALGAAWAIGFWLLARWLEYRRGSP